MEVIALAITLYPASGQAMRHQDLPHRQELRAYSCPHTSLLMQQTGMTHPYLMQLQPVPLTVG